MEQKVQGSMAQYSGPLSVMPFHIILLLRN